MTAGRRLSLVYHLIWRQTKGSMPPAADFSSALHRLSSSVKLWAQDPAGPNKLLYPRPWMQYNDWCACT